jgi:L-2-hydroxycarboxylate dehydrogenase (NAD+)
MFFIEKESQVMNNQEKSTTWTWKEAEEKVQALFEQYGVPAEDAQICTDILLEADRRGISSHGLNRLKPIYLDRIKAGTQNPVTKYEIVRETPTTAIIDGHNGMGQVISYHAMKMATQKAKFTGMGMVVVRNSNHYGIAGYYASMAAKAGCISINGTNARPSVAPTYGAEPVLGTNPLCFGIPTDEPFDFILDCATSITQRGKIEYYDRFNQPTPEGTVIDANGQVLTDSHEILSALLKGQASLAPLGGFGEDLGGYKGYGYCSVVEILSSALQSGAFLSQLSGIQDDEKVPYKLGHFFITIDVRAFVDENQFRKNVGDVLREVRASKKEKGQERIYTAGEKEHEHWKRVENVGLEVGHQIISEMEINIE